LRLCLREKDAKKKKKKKTGQKKKKFNFKKKKKKERETEEYDGKKNLRQSRRCKDNIKANFIKI